MAFKTYYFVYTAKNFQTGLTDVTAKVRRNGAYVLGTATTPLALTELDNGRYQLTLNDAQIVAAGGVGHFQIDVDSASKPAPATIVKEIIENDSDDVIVYLTALEAKIDTIDSNVDQALLDIAAVKSDTTSIKTTVEDTNTKVSDPSTGLVNIKALIDAVQATVNNISNVTRFSAPIPKPIIKPDTGTKTYKIPVRLFDTAGNLEDPDLDQIQLLIKNNAGTSRDSYINGFTAQPHYITKVATGKYEFTLDIPDTATEENLIFEFNYLENGIALSHVNTTQVIPESQDLGGLALESTSQSILTDTADMQPRVADIQSVVNNVTYGLAALKALIDTLTANVATVDTVVDSNNAELVNPTYGLSALKTILDGKASQASVTAITTNLDDNIKGAGFSNTTDSLKAISDRIFSGGIMA